MYGGLMTVFNRRYTNTFSVRTTPTITKGAYAAGDVVGGLLRFNPTPEKGGIITQARIVDEDNIRPEGTLWIFEQFPTAIADNGVFAPTAGDLMKCVGRISVVAADYTQINSLASYLSGNLEIPFTGQRFGVYFVCSGTPTFSEIDHLTISFSGLRD